MIDSLGTFSLSKVDPSWSKLMMLGVFDYYKTSTVNVFQIIPDISHRTLDVPDMTNEFNVTSEKIWKWLTQPWDYDVPADSTVVTNLKALFGNKITELLRVEHNEWEMFSGPGPDVQKEDIRVVSLATIIGIDPTLLPAIDLAIGLGLWRDFNESGWNSWG